MTAQDQPNERPWTQEDTDKVLKAALNTALSVEEALEEAFEAPPSAPEMTDAEAFAELANVTVSKAEDVEITERDLFESVPEGVTVTPQHRLDRGKARVRPFVVSSDLSFLRCDLCGSSLPRRSFVAHVNELENDKGETKSSSFYGCSEAHANEIAQARVVEKALTDTEPT